MSDIKWSKEQEAAIKTQDKNITISASAGAGKTMVLIARLMHAIEDLHISVDEILAMTFSELASQEMIKRLTEGLQKSVNNHPNDEFLREQLVKINDANISTIHGFCLDIIKEYYYIADLDKDRINNPLEEAISKSLKEHAMEKALEEAYQKQQFSELIDMFNNRIEGTGTLKEVISKLAYLADSKSDTNLFLDECDREFLPINSLKDLNEELRFSFFEFFVVQTNLLKDTVLNMGSELDVDVSNKCSILDFAIESLEKEDYETFRNNIKAALVIPVKKHTTSKNKKLLKDIETTLSDVIYDERFFVKSFNESQKSVNLLTTITRKYLAYYEEEKVKANGIDFSDMEHYAINVLKANDYYVANILKNKYKFIMVDEFQDTNDVQDELVKIIARDNNVFRVGDIKQSIYGFRHALPQIMQSLINHPTSKDEIIYFPNNYRSTKTIVDFNNVLYSKLMNVEGLGCRYSEFDKVTIGNDSQLEKQTPVMMHLINPEVKKEVEMNLSIDCQSAYIAKLVNDKHQEGYAYQDMVVLTRSNKNLSKLKKAFDTYNIPCFFSKKEGLYDSLSVKAVMSFLKALINPNDDLNFVGAISSDILRVKYEKIAKAKTVKDDNESFYDVLKNDEQLFPFNELLEKVHELSVSEVINEIYKINDFYLEYTNDQEKSNLDLLYELVCDYEKQRDISISGLLSELVQREENDEAEAMSVGVNDDVVRFMTIHASKGLEFKVVFLYSSNQFKKVGKNFAEFDEKLKISLKYLNNNICYPTITSLAFKQKLTKDFLEEELRVLYVATTRAEEELHIVDNGKKDQPNEYTIGEFYKAKGYTGWIRSALKISDPLLYQEEYVEKIWDINISDNRYSKKVDRYIYQGKTDELDFFSPSDSEIKLKKPFPFSYEIKEGAKRGSMLHKIIELLPNSDWDSKMIEDLAEAKDLTIDIEDYDKLLKLNSNPFFNELLKQTKVYHEYPFIVRKDNFIIKGYMDFVAVGDEVNMVDFKSDKVTNREHYEEMYTEQIDAYRDSLVLLYPDKKINTFIYSLEMNELIEMKK